MMEIHDGKKVVHPFFGKSDKSTPASFFQTDLPTSSESNTIEPKLAAPRLTSFDNEPENLQPASQNSSLSQLEGIAEPNGDGCIAPEAEHMEVDLNQSRRKRRRTTSPNVNIGLHSQDTESASPPEHANQQPQPRCGSPRKDNTVEPISHEQHTTATQSLSNQYHDQKESQIPISITNAQDQKQSTKRNTLDAVEPGTLYAVSHQGTSTPGRDETAEPVSQTKKPNKILHFNVKTGTIGSPPVKRSANANAGPQRKTTASRGRKKRKSLVIRLNYGQDATRRLSIGDKIGQISANTKPECTLQNQKVEVKRPPAKAEAAKSTHPFFLGKSTPKPPVSTNNDSPSLPAVSGPTKAVSPKTVLPSAKAAPRSVITSSVPSSKSNAFTAFGSSGKLMKFPGAAEPIWPPSGMTHIRGLPNDLPLIPSKESKIIPSEERKSKYTASETTANEDILKIISTQLQINAIHEGLKEINTDLYEAPDRCLRVPKRHFESGYKLQRRVISQIKSALNSRNLADDSSEDEFSKSCLRSLPHPAVIQLYKNIPTSLSAFDKSQYQTQSWIHKYSPHSAAEVLQSGREAFILKEWLQSLTVLAVDTGIGDSAQTRATAGQSKQSGAPKSEKEKGGKRKRKAKKLDGFIVSSDEEADDMDEVSDSDDFSPLGSRVTPKKTVIRRGDTMSKGSKEHRKLLNTVVISGPNGCGKTAAVYAVAKELGFEVFEINSSSRRSGKDILEKVGDMTKNHLVQQSQQQKPEQDDDLQRISDALDADLESGRQGTMKSFFKSSAPETKLPGIKKSPPPTPLIPKSTATASKKPKQQKQSLILLEEVDILFEEDKQFWTTVLTLIAQSKRPIIMTCNDESVVLNQPLPLHAVIRFTPPPVDLAVDYMLLVAANEGHVIQRQAVTALYQAQRFDLRASMTELEFWCQMGVGDRRGGFDWFCPRLPPGIDKDSHGDRIRVVSEGTYQTGMGWLGRDSLCDPSGTNDIEEEILRQTWDGWQLDAADWHETLDPSSWAVKTADLPASERLRALEAYDEFADAMSAADLCACGAFNTGNDIPLDTTTPPPSAKALEDTILGYNPLHAPSITHHTPLALSLSITLKSLALSHASTYASTPLAPLSEPPLLAHISTASSAPPAHLTRAHFSRAFDPVAAAPAAAPAKPAAYPLDASCLDRPLAVVAADVAPYIRGIVAYDARLARARAALGGLLSAGGRPGKKARRTRAAMAALEGGGRGATRRERWFEGLNGGWVKETGGEGWGEAGEREMRESGGMAGTQNSPVQYARQERQAAAVQQAAQSQAQGQGLGQGWNHGRQGARAWR